MKHLERAFDGQNQWWKFLLVFILAFIIGQLLGAIPLTFAMVFSGAYKGENVAPSENIMDFSVYGIDPVLGLALMVIPFITTLIVAILLVRSFHKRSLRDVINGGVNFRWERMLSGFFLWAAIVIILVFADFKTNPDNFDIRFDPVRLITLAFVAILFIPFQSGAEEYFFRGYLAQGVAGWTKRRWTVILIPAILFGLLHSSNPEVKEYGFWITMPQYILFGIFFGLVSILDDGIEMAVGVHAGNNIFSAIFITTKASALQTPALLYQHEVYPVRDLLYLLLASTLFIVLMSARYKWNYSILWNKIRPDEKVQPVLE